MRRRKRRNKDIKLITLHISFMSFWAACGPYVFVPRGRKICPYVFMSKNNNLRKICPYVLLLLQQGLQDTSSFSFCQASY